MTTATATTIPCPTCGHPCKGKLGLSVHRSMKHGTTAEAPRDPIASAIAKKMYGDESDALTFTLPYSLEQAPIEVRDWRIVIKYEQQTFDGVTFGAEVWDGSTLLGTIADQGNGGGTWFNHADPAGMAKFDAAVAAMVAAEPEEEFLSHETLCNRLYENAAIYRDLNRKRNATFLLSEVAVTRLDHSTDDFALIEADIRSLNKPLTDDSRQWIRNNFPTAKVWIKKQGWEQA